MKKTGFEKGYAEPATLDSSPLFGNSPPLLIQMPNPALIDMVAFFSESRWHYSSYLLLSADEIADSFSYGVRVE